MSRFLIAAGYIAGDSTSFTLMLGTLADLLPPLAAIMSIIWLTIRIYETKTVQCWVHCYRNGGCKECPKDTQP